MQSNEELDKIKEYINNRMYSFNKSMEFAETTDEELEYMTRVDELIKIKDYINKIEKNNDSDPRRIKTVQLNA